jgi:hypothetical protein
MLNEICMRCLIILLLSIMLLSGSAGCADSPRLSLLPPPPSEKVRTSLGTIGVVPARFAPDAKMALPAKGWLSGVGRGAGQGAAVGAIIGGEIGVHPQISYIILTPVTVPAFALTGSIVGIIAGSIYGAVTAPSPETVKQAESALNAAILDLKIQGAIGDRVMKIVQDQTRQRIILLANQDPLTPGKAISYRPLAEKGTDTILEISVPALRLERDLGANPAMALFMTLRARLIRTTDDELLYDGTVEYRSGKHRFTEWAADQAKRFRKAVNQGCQRLAERITEEIFLVHPPKFIASNR